MPFECTKTLEKNERILLKDIVIPIKNPKFKNIRFSEPFSNFHQQRLWLKAGYTWKRFPLIPRFKNGARASLVHSAMVKAHDTGALPDLLLEEAHKELFFILREDSNIFIASIIYLTLMLFYRNYTTLPL